MNGSEIHQFGSLAILGPAWRRASGVAEEARTRGFAAPAFAGCAFVLGCATLGSGTAAVKLAAEFTSLSSQCDTTSTVGDYRLLRFRPAFFPGCPPCRARDPLFALALFFLGRFLARLTRSGSFALPVSRFHSSNVSGEISPLTNNSANLRRCALLLNGMVESLRPEA